VIFTTPPITKIVPIKQKIFMLYPYLIVLRTYPTTTVEYPTIETSPTFYPIAKEQVKNNYPSPNGMPVQIYD
jgi:hypothetical protein